MSETAHTIMLGARKFAIHFLVQVLVIPAFFLIVFGMAYFGIPFDALHLILSVAVICSMTFAITRLIIRSRQHGR